MALPYTILDRQRVRFETYAETGSVDLDLTGRTLTLLVGDIVSIACSVTPGASSSTFTTGAIPPALADVAAGTYDYALVIDLGDASEERVAMIGDWIVAGRPDGTP